MFYILLNLNSAKKTFHRRIIQTVSLAGHGWLAQVPSLCFEIAEGCMGSLGQNAELHAGGTRDSEPALAYLNYINDNHI